MWFWVRIGARRWTPAAPLLDAGCAAELWPPRAGFAAARNISLLVWPAGTGSLHLAS